METFILMKLFVNSIGTMNFGGYKKNSSSSKSDKAHHEISFQMPLHYPRYKKSDYERMEERKVDMLLREYGLDSFKGTTLDEKREFAMGTFLWPDQL
ncbi:hypothetical protein MKW94_002698 [Papaver nudicaule]|uniref:DUF7722 domain-containing protein n=1 Tax=Papaver nudicaule TaxID=74823 RepID=A0AA41V1V8_PAPNU|nr:hypothetical protein [Papaver nudicaule]